MSTNRNRGRRSRISWMRRGFCSRPVEVPSRSRSSTGPAGTRGGGCTPHESCAGPELVSAKLGFDPRIGATHLDRLSLTGQSVLEVTAGPVFEDSSDELTSLRRALARYPHDVWRYIVACDRLLTEATSLVRVSLLPAWSTPPCTSRSRCVVAGRHTRSGAARCFAAWTGPVTSASP
jgi:hypothetical protein